MKNIFLFAILFVLTIGLISPGISFAAVSDSQPNECCLIGADFSLKINGAKMNFGNDVEMVVGEKSGLCKIDGADKTIPPDYLSPDKTKVYFCGKSGGGASVGECNSPVALEAWGIVCLINTIYIVTNWVFFLMMIVVVVMFIIAGAMYLMAGAKPDSAKRAKKVMLYSIIALVLALVAKLVPSVVRLIVGM